MCATLSLHATCHPGSSTKAVPSYSHQALALSKHASTGSDPAAFHHPPSHHQACCRVVGARQNFQQALTHTALRGLQDQAWADTVLSAALFELLAAQQGPVDGPQQDPAAADRGIAAACGLVDNALGGIQPEVRAASPHSWLARTWWV